MKIGWKAENLPAFVKEAYISSVNNFLVSVDFELESQNLPGGNYTSLSQSWQEIGATMMESSSFGGQLPKGKTKFLSDDVKNLVAGQTNPKEKIAALYYFLKDKMIWNESQNTFITSSLKEAYKKGKGNSADINLMLLGMLRQAGFKADPVLLSTKGHGFLNSFFPSLRQFNYVIVNVEVESGKSMLLDATDKSLPMELLPTKCFNDKGLMVNKEGIKWVDLSPDKKFNLTRAVTIALNEDLEWEGKMQVKCKDYAANMVRGNYSAEADESAYVASIESDHEGLGINNFTIEGINIMDQPIKESFSVNFSNQIMEGGDLLYFNPMMSYGMEENPFKLEDRTYPVDYPYPQSIVNSFAFTIPEGYIVEELPENKNIALPEKGGNFNYSLKKQGNKIILLSQFKINKHLFLPNEYPALKEFYNLVVAKQAEQVVLKKS